MRFVRVDSGCGKSTFFSHMWDIGDLPDFRFPWDHGSPGMAFYYGVLFLSYDIWSEGGLYSSLSKRTVSSMVADVLSRIETYVKPQYDKVVVLGHIPFEPDAHIYRSKFEDLDLVHESAKRGLTVEEFKEVLNSCSTPCVEKNWDVSKRGFDWISFVTAV